MSNGSKTDGKGSNLGQENMDHHAVRYVIWFLGLFALLGLVAIAILLGLPTSITTKATATEPEKVLQINKPDLSAVIALVGSAIGALGAMLAQTSTRQAGSPTALPEGLTDKIAAAQAAADKAAQAAADVKVDAIKTAEATNAAKSAAIKAPTDNEKVKTAVDAQDAANETAKAADNATKAAEQSADATADIDIDKDPAKGP
jgi:hypothetical protein